MNDCCIRLRPYQAEINQRTKDKFLAGWKSILVVSPTGSGKGLLIAHHTQRLDAAGRCVLVLGPTREIRDQLSRSLTVAGVIHGVIAHGLLEVEARVQVATVATMASAKRRAKWAGWADWILGDEAHHFVADTWRRVVADHPRARVVGYSATPCRSDGAALADMFDQLVMGPSTAELIAWGFLCPFAVFAPSAPDLSGVLTRSGDYEVEALRERMNGVVISAAPREWLRLCAGAATVVFAIDRAHGRAVEEAFLAAGIRAKFIDGQTPEAERRAALAALASGELLVLINCGLIAEGVDIPSIGAALLLRPTMSLALHLQQIGRALRSAKGKTRAIILDFAGNVERLGFPDDPREWSLEGSIKAERDRAAYARPRCCPACAFMNKPQSHRCGECGSNLRTPVERREAEIALAEARRREEEDLVSTLPRPHAVAWAGSDFDRLRRVARIHGHKPGWAYFQRQRALAAGCYQ